MNTKHRASFQGPITTVCHILNMVQKPKRGEKKAFSEKKKARENSADKPELSIRIYQIMGTKSKTTWNIWWVTEIKCFSSDWVVKNLPAMQETWVPSLDRKNPLEKEMATHSSIPARRIRTEEPGGPRFMGSQRVRHDGVTCAFTEVKAFKTNFFFKSL